MLSPSDINHLLGNLRFHVLISDYNFATIKVKIALKWANLISTIIYQLMRMKTRYFLLKECFLSKASFEIFFKRASIKIE